MFKTTVSLLVLSLGLLARSGPAVAQDLAPVVALHVTSPSKNPCFNYTPPADPCSQYATTGPLNTAQFVYLIVARTSTVDGLAGFSCSLDYDIVPGSGIDLIGWSSCPTSISTGWTGPITGGNRMVWSPTAECQTTDVGGEGGHTMAGHFYVYAYGEDVLSIVPNQVQSGPELAGVDCARRPVPIGYPRNAASVAFTADPVANPGFNPCASDVAISSITDVSNDQGKRVRIEFLSTSWDYSGSSHEIVQYEAFRKVDPSLAPGVLEPASARPDLGRLRAARGAGMLSNQAVLLNGWEFVTAVPAHGEIDYAMVAETLVDSTLSQGLMLSTFFVRAATADPQDFYDSMPDSGYSLDNLGPSAPPAPLIDPASLVTWDAPEDPDLDSYAVYGSSIDQLDGSTETLITTTGNLSFDVSAASYHFYHVAGIDVSGNLGAGALVTALHATPAGAGVAAPLGPDVVVTYDQVDVAGNTTLTKSSTGPSLHPALQTVPASPPVFYNITTEAMHTGTIEVCIAYNEAEVTGNESDLLIQHYDEDLMSWFDVTTSLDTGANTICGEFSSFSPFAVVEAGIPSGEGHTPVTAYRLHPSFPNPFSHRAQIRFDLPEAAHVLVEIYDSGGRRVRTLLDREVGAGTAETIWDGRNDRGRGVASGRYFYSVTAGSFRQSRSMILIR